MSKKKQHRRGGGKGDSPASLTELYPAHPLVDPHEANMVDLPGGTSFGSGFVQNFPHGGTNIAQMGVAGEEIRFSRRLPKDRMARYLAFEAMAEDPTIDSAIKIHMTQALSCNSDTGEAVTIEPVSDTPDPIARELKAALQELVNINVNEWAYNAAVYGAHFVRVYGASGKGLLNVRSDFYTHPRHVKKFEKAGQLAGFTSAYQGTAAHTAREIRLLPPWAFVEFQIPTWSDVDNVEPVNYGSKPVDLSLEDFENESIIESQAYGASLLETAYQPWMDLCEGICSLNMSRKNAARLERVIGVNTGRLDPEKAARFMNMLSAQMRSTDIDAAHQAWSRGNVQTVINRIIPVFGEKGRLDISTVQGTPDINGLEDVLFHVKRLGSALGVDPALLGFGDFLSGGLGDGGFQRISVMSGMKAQALRRAMHAGINRLCDLYVAYKYGKVFLPGERPWKICFNSLSTAIEREEQDALESRANVAGSLAGIMATLDQDFRVTDKRELMRFLWTGLLKCDQESFEAVFPKGMKAARPQEDEGEI